ncbi:eukaryotic translation initiation factor 4G [Drosophila guanche]|uniref:eukaryotic translation initiation factor 4G n=1 Tax=Drosophila guanche TaxID=7266 RepID=UPI0014721A32|nr:eukaryotic translation initiation factor 4G [Drosophila guanche]
MRACRSCEGPPMFLQTGGGGKGTRPQSTHHQNHNHHQTAHSHHHHLQQQQQQQTRNTLLHHPTPQQQQQQTQIVQQDPQQVHALYVTNHSNLHPHQQQQLLQHHQQQQQQQQQQQVAAQHLHQQQQPVLYYPPNRFVAHPSGNNNASIGGGAGPQLSAAASNSALSLVQHTHVGHGGHGNGVLSSSNSNTSLSRALNNTGMPPHFSQSAGLISTPGGNGSGSAPAAYLTTSFIPLNPAAQLIGMQPTVQFQNGAGGAQAAAFYTAAAQSHQKQLQTAAQQQQLNTGPAAGQIQYYQVPSNVNSGSNSHRGPRQRSATPQHQNYYTVVAPGTPRSPMVGQTAPGSVAPMMAARNGGLNGPSAYHIQPNFIPGLALGPPTGMNAAQILTVPPTTTTPGVGAGLHAYNPHIQPTSNAPPALAVANVPGGVPPGVGVSVGGVASAVQSGVTGVPAVAGGGFTTGSPLVAPQAAAVAVGQPLTIVPEKVRERRHAIPIIHPDTYEVLDTSSSVFVKKESSPDTSQDNETLDQYQVLSPILMAVDSSSNSQLPPELDDGTGMMVVEPSPDKIGGLVFVNLDGDQDGNSPVSMPPCTTDKDQISTIVKDILANASHVTDDHLSFWQSSDVDNVPATHDSKESNSSQSVKEREEEQPPQQQHNQQQRPKSANKQSTATPASIANDVAEAAASGKSRVTILYRNESMLETQEQQQLTAQKNTKSIATTAVPIPTAASVEPLISTSEKPANVPRPLLQRISSSTTTSGTSSSAASTPTHQPKQTQQQRKQQQQQQPKQHNQAGGRSGPVAYTQPLTRMSPALALLTGAIIINPTSKKHRKAVKRAKEIEKKKVNKPTSTTSYNSDQSQGSSVIHSPSGSLQASETATNTSNNSAASDITLTEETAAAAAGGILLADTSKGEAEAAAGAIVEEKAQPTTDKLSASSSSNSSVSSSLSDKPQNVQPKEEPPPIGQNNNNNDDNNEVIGNEKPEEKQHIPIDEIVSKFLQTNSPNKNTEDTPEGETPPQLQFLNSSGSTCGEEESSQSMVQCSVEQSKSEESVAVADLKFGDFNDDSREIETTSSSFICSSTWSSSTVTESTEDPRDELSSHSSHISVPSVDTAVAAAVVAITESSSSTTTSTDYVDCAPKQSTTTTDISTALSSSGSSAGRNSSSTSSSKKSSPVHNRRKHADSPKPRGGGKKQQQEELPPVTATTAVKLIRYSIDELRKLCELPVSQKPPLVPCQKGDCISQLFVSRMIIHPHHNHQQQQHLPQFQHMNFNESMDFVPGKRGRGHGGSNKKHHDGGHQQLASGSGNMGAASSSSGGSSSSNQRHMDIIRVQLSLKEEIKLSECENAWQPEPLRRKAPAAVSGGASASASASASAGGSEDDGDIDGVLKKVRGILNKLTPDNFDVLLKEMSSIKMDTESKMTNVMLLIFEKTISEPNFAPTYARFCKVLFHEIKAENKSLFTSSLITRIQHEFESNVNDANAKTKKLQPTLDKMNQSTDATRKAELRAEMEDLEYQFRRRAWGTVRFIGELYKLQSLTSDRVLHCVESLLEHGCEEKLEYMCKLLTTVGHLLESTLPDQYQLRDRNEKIFRRIQDIVNRSRGTAHRQPQFKISSRVRFMMQDVLDLRGRNWDQPVTPQQLSGRQRHKQQQQHDDSKDQQQQHGGRGNSGSQAGNFQQHKQHQHSGGHGHDSSNYFLQKMPNKQQQDNQALSIDLNKLRFNTSNANDDSSAKLGNPSHYQWRNRPGSGTSSGGPPTSLLKRATSGGHNITYAPYQQQQSQPSSAGAAPQPASSNRNSSQERSQNHAHLDAKQCQELISKLVDEAINERNWQPEVLKMWRSHQSKHHSAVLHYLLGNYLHQGTVRQQQRLACANVFAFLMTKDAVDKATFAHAYAQFGEGLPELLVDVPKCMGYLFEFVGPIMHAGRLNLKDVWQRRWQDNFEVTQCFVFAFVNYFVREFGAGYIRKLWHSDLKLDRGQMFWGDCRKHRDFVKSNKFFFLEPSQGQTGGGQRVKLTPLQRSPEDHVVRIRYLLGQSGDMAMDYINTNVGITVDFVRELTRFLCCDIALTVIATTNNNKAPGKGGSQNSSTSLQLNAECFRNRCTPLLRLCIDAKEPLDIACIDATVNSLQEHFMTELEDEMAACETICNAFSVLYDSEVIPKESFEKWYKLEVEHSSRNRRPFIDKLRSFIEDL